MARIALDGALGYCPQEVILNDTLTVNQHLDYFAAAYGIRDLAVAETVDRPAGLPAVSKCHRGNAQLAAPSRKLNLTLALMHDPRVLLLDEPYQGFDWETYLRFWDLAAELRARGCAVLIISHLLFDQQRFDALYQLHNGHLAMAIPSSPRHSTDQQRRRSSNDDPGALLTSAALRAHRAGAQPLRAWSAAHLRAASGTGSLARSFPPIPWRSSCRAPAPFCRSMATI